MLCFQSNLQQIPYLNSYSLVHNLNLPYATLPCSTLPYSTTNCTSYLTRTLYTLLPSPRLYSSPSCTPLPYTPTPYTLTKSLLCTLPYTLNHTSQSFTLPYSLTNTTFYSLHYTLHCTQNLYVTLLIHPTPPYTTLPPLHSLPYSLSNNIHTLHLFPSFNYTLPHPTLPYPTLHPS